VIKVKIFLLFFLLLVPLGYTQTADVAVVPLDYGIKTTVVTITSSITSIPATALSGRKSLLIKNLDTTTTIFIGNIDCTADETSTGGFPLAYHETFQGDIGENTIIYGIVASGSASVSVLEAR